MLVAFTDLLPSRFRPYAKLVIGLLGVAATILATVVTDNQIVTVFVSVMTALGVYGVPNKDSDGDGIPDFIDADSFKSDDAAEPVFEADPAV